MQASTHIYRRSVIFMRLSSFPENIPDSPVANLSMSAYEYRQNVGSPIHGRHLLITISPKIESSPVPVRQWGSLG